MEKEGEEERQTYLVGEGVRRSERFENQTGCPSGIPRWLHQLPRTRVYVGEKNTGQNL